MDVVRGWYSSSPDVMEGWEEGGTKAFSRCEDTGCTLSNRLWVVQEQVEEAKCSSHQVIPRDSRGHFKVCDGSEATS